MKYFVVPDASVYASNTEDYCPGFATYSQYNYLRPGVIAKLKRRRFDVALKIARPYFGRGGVIDFGCADGILLPSLARRFSSVVGVEAAERQAAIARTANATLRNVRMICDAATDIEALRKDIGRGFRLMFVLEVLEHVGRSPATMYEDKVALLKDLFSLLEPGGVIIASVPRMTGVAFATKYWIQRLTGMHAEPVTGGELVSAVVGDVDSLEPQWANGHIGFSEKKLSSHLREHFAVEEHGTLTSAFYMIRLIWSQAD